MNGKVKNKGTITEEDISMLLQRYQAMTILTLLQEVAQVAGEKIDWEAQVKKTSTGITSPREYQMLWRHLAYREPLIEKLEDGAEPLDGDSDLEFEVEVSPPVSCEASMEAAACVKVLMSSGSSTDAGPSTRPTVVAPLTINIPNGQASSPSGKGQASCSSRGLNITIPVSVQKQSLPATTPAEKNDGRGPSSSKPPTKKKRKLWTNKEDVALINGVQKFGEGNWQNILKQGFKHDRTASQLSQVSVPPRWSIIKKQVSTSNIGSTSNPNGKPKNTTLTEAQLSTRQAISMALNMPMIGSLPALCSGKANSGDGTSGTLSSSPTPVNPSGQPGPSEMPPPFSQKGPNQSQQAVPQGSQKGGSTTSKSQITQIKSSGPTKNVIGPNTLIQKAAFAAGGRIATPSTAASHFKAAQSKNAVHIRPGVSLSMTPVSGAKPSISAAASRPPNICQTRTAPLVTSIIPRSVSGSGSQQPATSSQLPSCGDTLQASSQQHMEEQKAADPVLDEVEGNAEHKDGTAVQTNSHVTVSNEGVKVTAIQQRKIAGNQNQMLVGNLDDGEDVHVMAESSSLALNSEQQQEKNTVVLQSQREHADDKCSSAGNNLLVEAKMPEEATSVVTANMGMVENGNSDANPSSSKTSVNENVNEGRNEDINTADK